MDTRTTTYFEAQLGVLVQKISIISHHIKDVLVQSFPSLWNLNSSFIYTFLSKFWHLRYQPTQNFQRPYMCGIKTDIFWHCIMLRGGGGVFKTRSLSGISTRVGGLQKSPAREL